MTLELADGRGELFQWDTGRIIEFGEDAVSQAHFTNTEKVINIPYTVEVKNRKAVIPDELLQVPGTLIVYAWVSDTNGGYTKVQVNFPVFARPKPSDYVYTPTEHAGFDRLRAEIGNLSALQTDAKDNLVSAINEAAASGGADWSQNDPSAKDYVKNRPGGYDIVTPEKVISEYQLQGNVIDVPIELSEPLVVGRSYRFTFYETADQSNTIFDGEVIAVKAFMSASDHDDAIAVIAPGCGYIIHPVTYPEKPALYRGYEDSEKYAYGHLKLVALAHTETVKIPNKYIINSDFIITATVESPEMSTLDKTFDQIQEAIRNGKRTVVHLPTPGPESENEFSSLQLLANDSEMILFSGTSTDSIGGNVIIAITLTISKKNKVSLFQGIAPTMTPDGTIRQLKMSAAPAKDMEIATKKYVDDKEFILQSTTPGSVKKFKLTIDDTGTLTATEVTA